MGHEETSVVGLHDAATDDAAIMAAIRPLLEYHA